MDTEEVKEEDMKLIHIPMSDIHPDQEFNCRGPITPLDVIDLAKDIKERGLVQPITVQPYSEDKIKETGKKYLLVAGYRRFMAYRVNAETTIPCVVNTRLTNTIDVICLNLAENTQRKNLNILQEAATIKKLMDYGLKEAQIREKLQKPRGWVQIRFMLMTLPEDIQNEAAAGVFTQQNIRDLYTVKDKKGVNDCFEAALKIKKSKERGETLPVTSPTAKSVDSKKHRPRPEIFMLMQHIKESVGVGLHSRVLSWCAGEISTGEIFKDLEEYATERGLTYTPPTSL